MAATFTFTDADSNVLDLHDGTNFRLLAIRGAGIAGLNHQSEKTPLQDGETYIRTLLEPRFVTAVLALMGTSFENMQVQRRSLVTGLNPKVGKGTLKYKPDSAGQQYAIDCYVNDGASFTRQRGHALELADVSFYCPDPAWYDPSANAPTVIVPAGGLEFSIEFPITFADNFKTETITNTGDLPSAPVITAPGPFVDPKISNDTAGKYLNFDGLTVASGETLTVDMGARTAEVDGASVFSKLTLDSEFWDLATGNNTVTVTLQEGNATFTFTYFTRYLGV